ncbi:chemotaxis-specific protein-glutamate methyltransferase CheB [Xanthobacter sp. KR7-65]|uniref:chemotaxis-specific protein-glutamate methyltransferase CheB n=1 Tax=Xanthobacter sp. KR7-65 TaxID=3156612 RepID=UPI0032B52AA9
MTKILIVDDSALVRRVLGDLFQAEGDFEIAFARDGSEALAQLHAFQPDVVTLDVEMPRMSGLQCLDRIMVERPCPVVMLSAVTTDGAEETLAALEMGAVDFVPKPTGTVSLAIDLFAPVLVEKVRMAASARLRRTHRLTERVRARNRGRLEPRPQLPPRRPATEPSRDPSGQGLVIIGTSTGGPPALDTVLSGLPADFPWPILVAQHMPASFTASLAQRLDGLCALRVVEVTRPTLVETGTVYVARGDADMIVSKRRGELVVLPTPASPEHRWHPSVDRLVASAAALVPPKRLLGVLMTGMGNDGARTMKDLYSAGGRTIAEAEESAVVWGMPGELVMAGGAEVIAPVGDIADRIVRMVPAG